MMGWRDTLTPQEITDLQALEAQLRDGYNEELEYQRRLIINRGHQRQTALNQHRRETHD